MDRDAQLIYEAYLAEADDELSTEVKDKATEKVHDEVKKAAEKLEKAGTDELTKAEKRRIKEIEDAVDKKGEGMSAIDKAQLALDAGGLASLAAPTGVGFVVGTVSDASNAVISVARGIGSAVTGDTDNVKKHFGNMALSLLGLVPYVGDAAVAAKLAAKGTKHAKGASSAAKAIRSGKEGAKAFGKAAKETIKSKGVIKHADELGDFGTKAIAHARKVKIAKAGALTGKGTIERGKDEQQGPVIDVPGTVEPAPEENTGLISPDYFRQRFARKPAL